MFFLFLGAGLWMNGYGWAKWSFVLGMVLWLGVLYQWFSDSVGESETGQYGRKIELSYRWSMTWFIFSEVMFFGAFLHRALVGAHAFGAVARQPGQRACSGLTSRRCGRALPPARRPRLRK